MKRHINTAILTSCAVFLLAGSLAAQEKAAPRPKAVVPEPIKDAGTVPTGEQIVHDFVIKNEGAAELRLTAVRPDCGCTAAEFTETIAPGQSGRVHAVLDTSTFGGPIAKRITVTTNDPDNPELQLTLRAKIGPYIAVQPGYARFVKVEPEGVGKVEQILWAPGGAPFDIVRVENPYPFLKVQYRPATAEDRAEVQAESGGWIVDFELDYTAAPIGALAQYVTLHTNHPKQKVVKIPVTGFVRPLIVVTPAELNFGQLALNKPMGQKLNLQSFATQPLTVTGVESDLKAADVSVTTVTDGKKFDVVLTLKPEMPKGAFAGTVKIHTDNPRKPVIEVPVRGTVL